MKHTIKGKDYEALINMYFLGEIQEIYNVTIDEVIGVTDIEHNEKGEIVKNEVIIKGLYNTNPIKYTYEYFYHCLRCSAELNEQPFDLKKLDIIKYIDENGGVMGKLAKGFMLDMTKALYSIALPEEDAEDDKKGKAKKK